MADLRPSLVPNDYVDPLVYDLEVERVLGRAWLPVCRVDQLAQPGDRIATTLAGRPVIAVRGSDGDIRVLGNVCPHRGSTIVDDGPGHDANLICPYHRWAFRLDGSLIGAPLAEGTDLDGACLPPVRHAIWEGFVLADLSGAAPDVTESLAGLSRQIAPWGFADLVTVATTSYESIWNWKVMVENWIECYHHIGTHRDSLEPFQPARTTRVLPNDGAPWVAMTVEGIEGIEGDPATWLPTLSAERARDLLVWAAFPTLLGGAMAGYAFWLQLTPVDVDRHRVTWYLLAHPDQLEHFTPEAIDHHMATIDAVHVEDMATCARVQAGIASGLIDRFRLAPLEAPIADFQRWVAGQRAR
jgi:phenylpropionate dioxygenase-like ring-hydroxylating dioxygenase large terminal subunit